jgi:hypothetical protein
LSKNIGLLFLEDWRGQGFILKVLLLTILFRRTKMFCKHEWEKMFKIPEKIKIGGINYSVKMFRERSGGMGLGQHDGKNSVIEIAQDIPPDRQAKTFVHEYLHGIIEQYGVEIPDEQEEKIVSQLSTGITEMIDQIVEFNLLQSEKLDTENTTR